MNRKKKKLLSHILPGPPQSLLRTRSSAPFCKKESPTYLNVGMNNNCINYYLVTITAAAAAAEIEKASGLLAIA